MAPKARTLGCPSCGSPIGVRHAPKAKTVACPSCDSVLDLTTPELAILGTANPSMYRPDGALSLGLRGTIDGVEVEVVGRLRLEGRDTEEVWHWDEWLLLRSDGSYLWLTEEEGTYTLETPFLPNDAPDIAALELARAGDILRIDDVGYRVAETDGPTIVHIEGELTWKASLGDRVSFLDARSGGDRIAVEWTAREIEWFRSGDDWTEADLYDRFDLTELAIVAAWVDEERAALDKRRRAVNGAYPILGLGLILALLLFCLGDLLNRTVASGAVEVPVGELTRLVDGRRGTEIGAVDIPGGLGHYVFDVDITTPGPLDHVTVSLMDSRKRLTDVAVFKAGSSTGGSDDAYVSFKPDVPGPHTIRARALQPERALKIPETAPVILSWKLQHKLLGPGAFCLVSGALLLSALGLFLFESRTQSRHRGELAREWAVKRREAMEALRERQAQYT